jgi:ABC-type sulfate transport system permease subunit
MMSKQFDTIHEERRKEQIMLTILLTFVVVPAMVIFGAALQRRLFKDASEDYDPEWERYQQRYD